METHLNNFYAFPLQNIDNLVKETQSIIESINENIDIYKSDPDTDSITNELNALKSSFTTITKLSREDVNETIRPKIKEIELRIRNDLSRLKNKEKNSRNQDTEEFKGDYQNKVRERSIRINTLTIVVTSVIGICAIFAGYISGQYSMTSKWKDEWVKSKIKNVILMSLKENNNEIKANIEELIDNHQKKFESSMKGRVDTWLYGYKFIVDTKPDNCIIRILNIKDIYKPGMRLKPGNYHIEVSKEGYRTKKSWVNIVEKYTVNGKFIYPIALDKIK